MLGHFDTGDVDVRGRAVSLKCKKEISLRRLLEVNSGSSLMFFVFTKRIGGIGWDSIVQLEKPTSKSEIIGIGFV